MLRPAPTAVTVMRLRVPLRGPVGKPEILKKLNRKSLQVAVSKPLPLLKSLGAERTKLGLWPIRAPTPRGSSPPSSPATPSLSSSPSLVWVSSSKRESVPGSSLLPSWTTAPS